VAASSRRTEEKVASRSGSGKHWRKASLARALSLSLPKVSSIFSYQEQMFLPKETAHDVFEKPCCLLLHELRDHVAEYSPNCVESLICCANVVQPMVIKKNLLDNENGHGLAEL
jgi:hypothetical protein